MLYHIQVQQNILTGVDVSEIGQSEALDKYKQTELVEQIRSACQHSISEEQKVRLIALYVCNYKLKNEQEFEMLCSLFSVKKHPEGYKCLNVLARLTQVGEDGKLFSDSINHDKHSRMTAYIDKSELQHYQKMYLNYFKETQDFTRKFPRLLQIARLAAGDGLPESTFPFKGDKPIKVGK